MKNSKNSITAKCVAMCVKDMRAFNAVSSEGFRELGQELMHLGAHYGEVNVADVMPHPSTISKHVKEQADAIRNSIMPSVINKTYWCLVNNVLFATKFHDVKKTGINIMKEIEERVADWNITRDMLHSFVFVSDRDANVIQALENHERIPCAAHCISTALSHTVGEGNFFLNTAKYIVRYITKSGFCSSLKSSLKQEVCTRWNSLYTMLESLHIHYNKVAALLTEKDSAYRLKGYDNELHFLRPFKEDTDELEGEKEPTFQRTEHLTVKYSECNFARNTICFSHGLLRKKAVS
ncbi:uncharacterized protein LOC124620193 [Schistocerca americana]|uniref:uncharacterized protein LOC124620193 n=1 Tax=Schistocerca americana TaxID=7009 RepID=UPI001F4F59CE|nr:uncharacterized protein LOC124620193 [Schistocerca americana]